MLRTLRNRLILSHLLPLLIVVPLAGIAFVYVLETKVILPGLSEELVTEAKLIAEVAGEQPGVWQDKSRLDALILRLSSQTNARLMFLDPQGLLLASSDPADDGRLGKILDNEYIGRVQTGDLAKQIDYSKALDTEVIDVFMPVYSSEKQLIGIIRMSYPFMSLSEELLQLRTIILGILTVTLIAGVVLGSMLAITTSTPIQQVTKAIDELARGNKLENVEVHGPEEIQSLAKSTNLLVERLRDLEKARTQLLANLVHEIGRPLGAIRSSIQSLKMGAGNNPQLLADLTTGMDEETVRLQYLLNDLAHLHDQVFGSLELDRQIITPNTWIPTVLQPLKDFALYQGLDWGLPLAENLPEFKADPYRMAQALENLVNNAIKYTPKGGKVMVTAGFNDEIFWIKVSDTGPGIAPEEIEKIFEPFFRGGKNNQKKQGMGLGLSIARDLVVAHGGDILVESKLGEGSTFTIQIPRARSIL